MNFHSYSVDLALKYGIEKAVLIHHIAFWVDKNKKNNINYYKGKYWTYNSANDFSKFITEMNPRQIERLLKQLVEDDEILIRDNFNKKKYDKTYWYTFKNDLFLETYTKNCDLYKKKIYERYVNGNFESDDTSFSKNEEANTNFCKPNTNFCEPIPDNNTYYNSYNNNNITNLENSSNQRIHKFEQLQENLNNQRNSEENLKFNDFQEIENSKRNKQSNSKFDDFLENKHKQDEKYQKNDIFDLDMQDEKDLIENKKQQEIKLSKEKRLTKEEYDNLFNLFWKQYPRKEGVAQARKNFIHALRKSGFEKIMQSLETYKKDLETRKVEKCYILHGSTFIGTKTGGRYMDYLPEEIEDNNPVEYIFDNLKTTLSEKNIQRLNEVFSKEELRKIKQSFLQTNKINKISEEYLERFEDYLMEEFYAKQ